ncbi:Protein phosphatase 2C family protein [Trifolium repens]|nr:Protein phosphatase 2C family protein [Trifolium repens]
MVSFNLLGFPYKKYNIKLDATFDNDPLAWSRPLVRHHCGEFSMAAVKANMDMEDQSQVEVGTDALFVGVYDGHKGDTTAIYLRDHIFGDILRRIPQTTNDPKYSCVLEIQNILRQGVAEMERGFIEFARNSFEQQHEVKNSFVSSDIQLEFTPNYLSDPHSLLQSIKVKGLIETSRCIGYAYLKNAQFTERRSFEIPLSEVVTPTFTGPFLSSQPEVYSRVLSDTDRFIIFGSGGFWKLISNEKAARVVNTSPRDRIAERLVTIALEKGARKRGKKYAALIGIPASNCVSGNNGNQNLAYRSAYHDDITVIVVYLDKRPNGEGVRPEINSYTGYDDEVRQSEFRNFYNNNANA